MPVDGNAHAPGLPSTTATTNDKITAAVASRVADTIQRRQRVIAALDHAEAHGHAVSIAEVTRVAAIHRVFLYRHRDLLDRLRAMETAAPTA
jgi:hypothetical protein